ncbi:hypothetical protein [Ancylobacter sp. IITR112]|uniref:hypothetical protein n=1 Tax=Ancylobacter sp. IITR112 TaxID=3138073 RepID=UPI00352AE53D
MSIYACRDTLAAGLVTRFSGLHPSDTPAVHRAAMPRGVDVKSLESTPAIVTPLRSPSLDEIHNLAITRAWASGAWDITLSLTSPLDDSAIMMVVAGKDYDLAPGLRDALISAGQKGRLALWLWRPIHRGSPTRGLAHAAKDRTLQPDGSRAGEPPEGLKRPIWSWRGSRQWTIRLGQWSETHRPATAAQRRYLAVLLSQRRDATPIPALLSFARASEWIDTLKGDSA